MDLCLKDSDFPKKLAENINKVFYESRNEPGTSAQADLNDRFQAKLYDEALADILNMTANDPAVDSCIQEATGEIVHI